MKTLSLQRRGGVDGVIVKRNRMPLERKVPVFHRIDLCCDSARSAASTPEVLKDEDSMPIACNEASTVRPCSCEINNFGSDDSCFSPDDKDISLCELQQLRYACSKLLTRNDEMEKDEPDDVSVVDVKKVRVYFKNRHMNSPFQNFSSKLVRNRACLDLKGLVIDDVVERRQDHLFSDISESFSSLCAVENHDCNGVSKPVSQFQEVQDHPMDHSADIWKISCSLNVRVT
uniref:Uncharacterized protein n=1 Tax=Hanusia phi TaxID=3032 RepID=A0A7S0EG73_9CRYP|mmetsp:Transcript_23962/g.53705  ORF Transcript_23962/g.53705 Transcript_23962/m.53705 type:complete len:230 (+) Transcript_23962:102-791(+)